MTITSLLAALPLAASLLEPSQDGPGMASLQELIIERGGVLMIPIALCSLVAMAFAIERWLALRSAALGSGRLGREIVEAARDRGAHAALDVCEQHRSKPLARTIAAGLARIDADFSEREKVVEDAAHAEIQRMGRNLRPLFLVWLIAPLLGLLGTVWGMIKAFGNIAVESGIGKPELLADGIYGALTTTAGGLAVAIPAIVAYWYLQGRIEAFAARVESTYREVETATRPRAPRPVSAPAAPAAAAHTAASMGS